MKTLLVLAVALAALWLVPRAIVFYGRTAQAVCDVSPGHKATLFLAAFFGAVLGTLAAMCPVPWCCSQR